MSATRLEVGDAAPDFLVMAYRNGSPGRVGLQDLLAGNRGLVLTSYVLDFTGG